LAKDTTSQQAISHRHHSKPNRRKKKRSVYPKTDYLYVDLPTQYGTEKFLIHRLVAFYFVPNPDMKPYVHHKDHNRLNPKWNNLEWVSAEENNDFLHTHRGPDFPKELQIQMIELRLRGCSGKTIAKLLNLNASSVGLFLSSICKNLIDNPTEYNNLALAFSKIETKRISISMTADNLTRIEKGMRQEGLTYLEVIQDIRARYVKAILLQPIDSNIYKLITSDPINS